MIDNTSNSSIYKTEMITNKSTKPYEYTKNSNTILEVSDRDALNSITEEKIIDL